MGQALTMVLAGPLQSYGLRARWTVRDTATEPTKSAVVGLLARCLGRESDSDISALSSALFMGVRVDREGYPADGLSHDRSRWGLHHGNSRCPRSDHRNVQGLPLRCPVHRRPDRPRGNARGLPQSLAPACRRALPRTTLLRADRTPGWQPHRSRRSGGCAAASPCRHARTRAATDAPTGCHRGAGGPRRHRGRRFGPSRCPALSRDWEHADRMVRETWIDLVV